MKRTSNKNLISSQNEEVPEGDKCSMRMKPGTAEAEVEHSPGCLPEGSTLHILTRESDVDPLLQQRAEGHVLPQSPVHQPVTDHLPPAFQDTTQT